jgi:hypothetical protein
MCAYLITPSEKQQFSLGVSETKLCSQAILLAHECFESQKRQNCFESANQKISNLGNVRPLAIEKIQVCAKIRRRMKAAGVMRTRAGIFPPTVGRSYEFIWGQKLSSKLSF